MAVPQSVLHGFDMSDWWWCGDGADALQVQGGWSLTCSLAVSGCDSQREPPPDPRLVFIMTAARRPKGRRRCQGKDAAASLPAGGSVVKTSVSD